MDYNPFGMLVPERHAQDASDKYRYGFQGQEKDDELKGDGNSLNYEFRMYDPRIGRFFAVDPLTRQYPHYTPYSFSGNRVIDAIEFEGLEEKVFQTIKRYEYKPVFKKNKEVGNLERVGNAVTNCLSFVGNIYVGYHNSVQTAANHTVWAISGEKQYDFHQTIVAPLEEFANDSYKYHTDTPAKQQFIDIGDVLTNLETWELAATAFLTHKLGGTTTAPARLPLSMVEQRQNLVKSFFKKYDIKDVNRGLMAIDMDMPVFTQTLKKGTKLYRWSQKSSTAPKHFFSLVDEFGPSEAGLTKHLRTEPTDWLFEEYTLTKDTKVLRSNVKLESGTAPMEQVTSTQIEANATRSVIKGTE